VKINSHVSYHLSGLPLLRGGITFSEVYRTRDDGLWLIGRPVDHEIINATGEVKITEDMNKWGKVEWIVEINVHYKDGSKEVGQYSVTFIEGLEPEPEPKESRPGIAEWYYERG